MLSPLPSRSASFTHSGVFLSGICLFGFAFLAYFTLTFLIEVMVIANVMLKFRGDFGEVPVFELQYKGNRKQYRAVNSSTWTLVRTVCACVGVCSSHSGEMFWMTC